ncbi:TetR family transcriptional regulator [Paeniglutamicibacter antarcticus]|uniref:TetR family transcriptional regulator n=1 Tax=Arthrobacter terrae TaxID=2935737 RepID=A0A931G4J9_9MICC|nr:TetR/AcrR family transcriptional regulator [Arthrobacter terrae]MBG0739811.1 TetR family transcriptional regulator [Arthrobacter terrae]
MENGAPAVEARRRAGRPPHPVLGPGRITKAALRLIARDGYKGLTMSALARLLNVAPSALYNHVSSKQDVLLLVEDHLMAGVDISGFEAGPWHQAVRGWAWSYRNVFARHTPLIPVIAVLPVTNAPQTVKMYEAVTAGFHAAGWPPDQIIDAIVALESFIFGSAFDVNAPAEIFNAGELAADAPLFTQAVASRASGSGSGPGGDERPVSPSDTAFGLGLEALIDGLWAQRALAPKARHP